MNSYILDPARITPSRSDATSNGHFPLHGGQNPTGTPRGFSLANMPYMGAGFQGVPGSMPMMGMGQGNWGGNGMMGGDLHQPGVMRRGGRFNNRSGGPYDRRGRYNHQGGGGGRLSPVRGTGMYGAGGRVPGNNPGAAFVPAGHPAAAMMMNAGFPDATGGPAMPREAVQGRSLKSYEDLDAVGGAGGGELNY